MCGIVGYVGDNCLDKIISGLESLEYRGYDSAGIAYYDNNKINIIKEVGKIDNLKKIIPKINSNIGIGHTRWATHGIPSKINSHPHRVGKVTLVHNGIIENYQELKNNLKEYQFKSETDSEVVAALIDKMLETKNILDVLNELKNILIGSYALGIMIDGDNTLYATRKDSPLIVGVNDKGYFIASDVPAIIKYTNKYYLLENNEYIKINKELSIYKEGKKIIKDLLTFEGTCEDVMKNGYDHFMLKEIFEQPEAINKTIEEYLTMDNLNNKMEGLEKFTSIDIVGCGSAYNVGLVGSYLIQKYGNIPVNCYIASEYRYQKHFYTSNHLILLISQSGETADTLAVLRNARENNIPVYSIINVFGSSIARESNKIFYTKAGSEISVATTKAYSCQLIILSLMATYLGIKNKNLSPNILNKYHKISNNIKLILDNYEEEKELAKLIYQKNDIYYLGRSLDYALCLESSLKLKEISYIHSEAYPSGELKHGSISLISQNTPVISIITDDYIKQKTLSNVKEVCARGAMSIVVTSFDIKDQELYTKLIKIPKEIDLIECLYIIVKMQLLAYYTGVLRNCDIDKPRNLAKSVTVE